MTAKWRDEAADAKLDMDKQRLAANRQEAPPRSTASPLDKLYARRELDRDMFMNGVLHGAGMRYYSDWYLSGLNGLSGIDYSRVGVGGSGDNLPQNERQEARRRAFRKAHDYLGERYTVVVDPVVLEERPIGSISAVTGYANRGVASAVALERLNTGLRRLALHYGMVRP